MMMRFEEAQTDANVPSQVKQPPSHWKIMKEFGHGARRIILYEVQ